MLNAIIVTFLVSMVPIIELRGALPIGVGMGLPPFASALISILGNLIPIPFILIFLPKIFAWLQNKKIAEKLINWLNRKAEKNRKTIEKYGYVGLYILVAIPLPGTGAWTGALVSSCFGMSKKKSLIAISLGVLTAAAIVLLLTYGVILAL